MEPLLLCRSWPPPQTEVLPVTPRFLGSRLPFTPLILDFSLSSQNPLLLLWLACPSPDSLACPRLGPAHDSSLPCHPQKEAWRWFSAPPMCVCAHPHAHVHTHTRMAGLQLVSGCSPHTRPAAATPSPAPSLSCALLQGPPWLSQELLLPRGWPPQPMNLLTAQPHLEGTSSRSICATAPEHAD